MNKKQIEGWIFDDSGYVKIRADYKYNTMSDYPERIILSNAVVLGLKGTTDGMFDKYWTWNINNFYDDFRSDIMGISKYKFIQKTISLYKHILKNNYESRL